MEQTKGLKRVPKTDMSEENPVVETVKPQDVFDSKELVELLNKQAKQIEELERRVLPQQVFVENKKKPVYRMGMINGKFVKSVKNEKEVKVDDRGKAYVVQEFVVSFFGDEPPQRMSMTVYRELVQRVETELVEYIYGDSIDPVTGKADVESIKVKATHPVTGVTNEYIINKNFVNL